MRPDRRYVVLDAPIGGLGDSLLFSTLPDWYRSTGCSVFVSQRTIDNCRNPEVADLLYLKNRSIAGIWPTVPTEDEAIGIKVEREFFLRARHSRSPVSLIEQLHGIDYRRDTGRPRLDYAPEQLTDWPWKIAVDPRSISQRFTAETFNRFVAHTLLEREKMVVLDSQYGGFIDGEILPDVVRYRVRDIYEYIDIVASCKAFLCTESGSQSIGSAVRDTGTFALCTTMSMNSRLYIHPNVVYTVTGKLSDDYLWNDTTAEGVEPRW